MSVQWRYGPQCWSIQSANQTAKYFSRSQVGRQHLYHRSLSISIGLFRLQEQEAIHHGIKFAIVDEGKYEGEDVEERLAEPSHISQQVQYAVHLSIDHSQVEVQLVGDRDVDIVDELIRTRIRLIDPV